ncbi:phospholipase [Phycicoccus sp. CSK15P-2]|uniref:phospholipase D family protein n=1 Tax=Phycicoccus sp. CSK15P-2 TaxID=2807627 RepID=UPI00194EF2E1|nr:phospholipase D-like domain-containing protein [Phycicoccus sp. CSK15P-2]MBM6404525.1 phospholipase [Phycicoccus sp. CSK15P-2]
MLSHLFLTPDERANPDTRVDAVHPDGVAWSTGNRVRPIVHGAPYFAELAERLAGTGPGDLVLFADWRGDPDQQLTDDPEVTLGATLAAAARRGAVVRGLLWRSHWRRLGYHADRAWALGARIDAAGGQCLRDMRVAPGGSHHQKLVVVRYRDDPVRDIAYVGGIDLCHSRRDTAAHEGDPQQVAMPQVFGPRPPWHDVHCAIQGPAVHDVETSFRERWEDGTPLTLNPGRLASSLAQGEDLEPEPLPEQAPPPPAVDDGHEAVQVLRTYPRLRPVGHDFASDGEQSIARGNGKALRAARRLVYLEDQFLWSEEVGRHFGDALRRNPELRLVVVLPIVPDVDGALSLPPQLHGRSLAMDLLLDAGGDRVALYGLTSPAGFPVYVHSKVCVVDDVWVSVGSDNFNRRSWTNDSELSVAVQDERQALDGGPAPRDSFALRLRRELVAEHVGLDPAEVPDDPDAVWDLMASTADALDAYYGDSGPSRGRVHVPRPKAPFKGTAVRWRRRGSAAVVGTDAERPPGRLRRLGPPELSRLQRLWAPRLYDVIDPNGPLGLDAGVPEAAER